MMLMGYGTAVRKGHHCLLPSLSGSHLASHLTPIYMIKVTPTAVTRRFIMQYAITLRFVIARYLDRSFIHQRWNRVRLFRG